MRTPPHMVHFGYRTVGSEEKKKLGHDQFSPIARSYDRAVVCDSTGPSAFWPNPFAFSIPPAAVARRLAGAGLIAIAVHPRTFRVAVIYFGRKPEEVSDAEHRS